MIALLSLLVSLAGGMDTAAPQNQPKVNYVTRLQIDTTLLPKESLEVVASCEVRELRNGDLTAYVIDDVALTLVSHRVGYANHRILHEYKDRAVYRTASLTTSLPLWDGKYVPSDRFVLPSSRVCKCGKDVYYVLCTGSNLTCFALQRGNDNLTRLTQVKPADYPPLKSVWEQTFSPHDVYWCYYLILFAKTFGLPRAPLIDHKKFVDTEYLSKLYTSLNS